MAVEKEWPNRATGEKYSKAYIRITDFNFSNLIPNQRMIGFVGFTVYASSGAYKAGRTPIAKFRISLTNDTQYKKDKGKYVDQSGKILSETDDIAKRVLIVPSIQDILAAKLLGAGATVNDAIKSMLYISLRNSDELSGGQAV
jgi:hypothetical protein